MLSRLNLILITMLQLRNKTVHLSCCVSFFFTFSYVFFTFTAKGGTKPAEAWQLVEHVLKNCPNLHFKGLMTIGQYGYDVRNGPNPDFITLSKCRQEVCEKLLLDVKNVELSMGMSTDFEHAVCIHNIVGLCITVVKLLASDHALSLKTFSKFLGTYYINQ